MLTQEAESIVLQWKANLILAQKVYASKFTIWKYVCLIAGIFKITAPIIEITTLITALSQAWQDTPVYIFLLVIQTMWACEIAWEQYFTPTVKKDVYEKGYREARILVLEMDKILSQGDEKSLEYHAKLVRKFWSMYPVIENIIEPILQTDGKHDPNFDYQWSRLVENS